MLSDRDYMREDNRGRGGMRNAAAPSGHGISAVATLIIINVIVFMLESLNPGLLNRFSLISPAVLRGSEYFRLVTYMFLHGGFMHIFFNMYALYLFGTILESKIGKKSFYIMYFISGITGGLLWILVNPNYPVPCIGASGSMFGVIIASAMFVPDAQFMMLIPPVPLKLKTLAVVYILLELFMFEFSGSFRSIFSNIAHIVHLGGAAGGYLYIKIVFRDKIQWDILPFGNSKRRNTYSSSVSTSGWSVSGDGVSQAELDRLLDKISVSGINSLTEDELATLRNAREKMKR
jgi:membrane associated rhomboid family serine protease